MKKKIVFVTSNLNRGGAEKMLTFVANSCVGIFDDIILISLYKDSIEFSINDSINIFYLTTYNKKYKSNLKKMIEYIKLIKKLRIKLKQIEPNIICSFGVNHIMISYLAAFGLRIKVIGSERRSPENLPIIWKYISKFIYPRCSGMVFQLDEAKNFYKIHNKMRVAIIPNPYISEKKYIPCDFENREKTIVGAAARFEYAKGFDTLIRAFKIVKEKHNEFKLIIYAKGDYQLYNQLIKELNLENDIIFPGYVDNIADVVYSSSVFVLPSRFEGIPNILLEVMGAGVPTVSCDCPPGGPRLLTKNGTRGLLVPVDDYRELANAICKIIEDKDLSSFLSKKGLEIINEFDVKKISKMWVDFFISII